MPLQGVYIGIAQFKATLSKHNNQLTNRTTTEVPRIYNKLPSVENRVDSSMKMDFSRILGKPYHVGDFTWTTAQTAGHNFGIAIPESVILNRLADLPFSSSCLYRIYGCVQLQVSGTPLHTGILVAGVMPRFKSVGVRTNDILCSPHAFMSATQSTPVCIEAPFYSSTHLRESTAPLGTASTTMLQDNSRNYAHLVISVLSPLGGPTGSSTSLNVSIYFSFDNIDFYIPKDRSVTWTDIPVPPPPPPGRVVLNSNEQVKDRLKDSKNNNTQLNFKTESKLIDVVKSSVTALADNVTSLAKVTTSDFIDGLRSTFRYYTGLHNPNIADIEGRKVVGQLNYFNYVDRPTYLPKMDPFVEYDRMVRDPVFNTEHDEMLITNIISKPQKIGEFTVSATDSVGKMVFSRPIHPFMERYTVGTNLTTVQALFYSMSRYWKGSMKLHIQASMNDFQYCKLLVCKDYSCDAKALTAFPAYAGISNYQTDIIEFSGGGQITTIDLPFNSTNNQIECTLDFNAMALSHGMLYIYVQQPIAVSASSLTNISFHVYLSCGPDFQFYGYPVRSLYPYTTPALVGRTQSDQAKDQKELEQNAKLLGMVRKKTINFKGESKENKSDDEYKNKYRMLLLQTVALRLADLVREIIGSCPDCIQKCESCATLVFDPESRRPSFSAESKEVLDQSDLINEPTKSVDYTDALHFRPIVSMRDYFRRFTHCRTFSLDTLSAEEYKQNNIFFIRVSDILEKGMFRAFAPLFAGMVGGMKIKIRAYGIQDMNVSYIPPSSYLDGNQFRPSVPITTEADFKGAETSIYNTSGTPTIEYEVSNLAPSVETSAKNIQGNIITKAAVAPETKSSITDATSQNEVEFVIPFLNGCDWMNTYEVIGAGFNAGLGHFMVNYTLPFDKLAHSSTLPPQSIDVFAAFTDETRLGYQCYGPEVGFYKYNEVNTGLGGPYFKSDSTTYAGSNFGASSTMRACWSQNATYT